MCFFRVLVQVVANLIEKPIYSMDSNCQPLHSVLGTSPLSSSSLGPFLLYQISTSSLPSTYISSVFLYCMAT